MSKIKNDTIRELAELKGLTTYHYKVILYLMSEKESTQVKIAESLGTKRQNINRVFKDLHSMDIVEISRSEGKNIYWKLNAKPELQVKGQMKLEEI